VLRLVANGCPWEIRRVHTVLENPLCMQAPQLLISQAFSQRPISMPLARL
jgi:hypothetical protein